ncbi:MAG: autotransporter outer membrane beta-barrel domain-containing protein [Planctomycetota bacterium]|nr:autotransporter outer membrane beta-barrel domain-containing protein [Planctomycetota bacterium]
MSEKAVLAAAIAFLAAWFPALAGTPTSPTPTASLASISVQRIFKDTLPSVADYSQTAHSQAQAPSPAIGSETGLASPICGASICGPNSNWVMWDTPFMQFDRRDADSADFGYKFRSDGFATGISRLFGEYAAVGLALGYDRRKLDGKDNAPQRSKGDAFHAAIYGGAGFGSLFVDAYAGFSWTSERGNNGAAAAISSNYGDSIFSGGIKASYVLTIAQEIRLVPHIGFDYSHLRNGSYNEGGAGGQAVKAASHDFAQIPLGVAINKTFSSDFLNYAGNPSLWTPEIRAAFTPQIGSQRIRNEYWSGQDFTAGNAGRYLASAGAGLKVQINDRFILGVDYDCRLAKKYRSHVITGTYGISF